MKILRILVLLTMTSMVPTFLPPAMAQQEINPEHFDQAEPAKTAQSKQPKTSPKAAMKKQRKSISKASNASRTTPRPPQVKAENQPIAAVHSTGE